MFFSFYSDLVNKIAAQEEDPINRARVRLLVYGLTSNLFFTGISTVVYYLEGVHFQFIRALMAFVAAIVVFYAVARWRIWKAVSHVLVAAMTAVVWSNLLFYVQGVNTSTIQYVLLVIVYSFYVHGLRFGLLYSSLNVVPILLYTIFDGRTYFSLPVGPQQISQTAYLFVISYNFLILIFLHYHFFKAFRQNLDTVTLARDEMKRMNAKLELAMGELEKSSNAKMDFLSTMSHELRTPLNGVIGLTNVLLMESPREDQKENLSVLKFSAENLLALINDILDLNKLESNKIELECIPFNLEEHIKNTCAGLKLKAEEKGLEFKLEIAEEFRSKIVKGDPTRLGQVLMNLVNNAVKFTEKGSVAVVAKADGISGEQLTAQFRVSDTGIGIDKDKQDDVFEPFTQASKSTTRKFGGTGLGLAIVKRILEVHNSEIKLHSRPGAGTSFSFDITFNYQPALSPSTAGETASRSELRGLRVLVAEDNPINVMVIRKILSLWKIVPVIAENGRQALDKLHEEAFDVVLMDLHMPVMDGYEASRAMRTLADPVKSGIPIIALTASVSSSVNKKVLDAGMNDFLSKPFNPQHLYEKLRDLTAAGGHA